MSNNELSIVNKVGRKSLYRKEYCEQLIEHCSQGLSVETFGCTIGVSTNTIYEWAKLNEEFDEAKNIARDKHRKFYEQCITRYCCGLSVINPSAAMWMLERTQRKDYGKDPTVVTNLQVNQNETKNIIDIKSLSIEAQKSLAKEIIKKRELANGTE